MLNATNIFPIIKGFESNYVETEGFSTVLKCTATYIFVQYKNIAQWKLADGEGFQIKKKK